MYATTASIGVGALLALGNPLEVEVESNPLIGTKYLHHLLPLGAMGFNATGAVEFVYDKVGDFVRYGIVEVFLEVFGENPGIVANPAAATHQFEHAGSAPRKVKQDRHLPKAAAEDIPRLLHISLAGSNHFFLFKHPDGLYQYQSIPPRTRATRCHFNMPGFRPVISRSITLTAPGLKYFRFERSCCTFVR